METTSAGMMHPDTVNKNLKVREIVAKSKYMKWYSSGICLID